MQEWAVSGGQKGSFGGRKAFTPLKWVMLEDIPPILSTKKSVQVRHFLSQLNIGLLSREFGVGICQSRLILGLRGVSRKKKRERQRTRKEAQEGGVAMKRQGGLEKTDSQIKRLSPTDLGKEESPDPDAEACCAVYITTLPGSVTRLCMF